MKHVLQLARVRSWRRRAFRPAASRPMVTFPEDLRPQQRINGEGAGCEERGGTDAVRDRFPQIEQFLRDQRNKRVFRRLSTELGLIMTVTKEAARKRSRQTCSNKAQYLVCAVLVRVRWLSGSTTRSRWEPVRQCGFPVRPRMLSAAMVSFLVRARNRAGHRDTAWSNRRGRCGGGCRPHIAGLGARSGPGPCRTVRRSGRAGQPAGLWVIIGHTAVRVAAKTIAGRAALHTQTRHRIGAGGS